MKAKETIARIESIIYTGFEWICRVILVFITLLIAVQVFLRAAFRYSIPWSEEVSLMGFIYITFFSMAIAVRHDQHLRVELFVSKFPRAGKKAIDLIDNIVMLAISIMMFYTGIKLVVLHHAFYPLADGGYLSAHTDLWHNGLCAAASTHRRAERKRSV